MQSIWWHTRWRQTTHTRWTFEFTCLFWFLCKSLLYSLFHNFLFPSVFGATLTGQGLVSIRSSDLLCSVSADLSSDWSVECFCSITDSNPLPSPSILPWSSEVLISLHLQNQSVVVESFRAQCQSSKFILPSVYFKTKNVRSGGAWHINQTASYTEGVDSPAAVHPGCPPLAPCCCTCPFQGSLICLMH